VRVGARIYYYMNKIPLGGFGWKHATQVRVGARIYYYMNKIPLGGFGWNHATEVTVRMNGG